MAEGQVALPKVDTKQPKQRFEAAITIFLLGGISDALKDSYYVLSVMQLILLMLIPKNEINNYLID